MAYIFWVVIKLSEESNPIRKCNDLNYSQRDILSELSDFFREFQGDDKSSFFLYFFQSIWNLKCIYFDRLPNFIF